MPKFIYLFFQSLQERKTTLSYICLIFNNIVYFKAMSSIILEKKNQILVLSLSWAFGHWPHIPEVVCLIPAYGDIRYTLVACPGLTLVVKTEQNQNFKCVILNYKQTTNNVDINRINGKGVLSYI